MKTKRIAAWIMFSWVGAAVVLSIQPPALAQVTTSADSLGSSADSLGPADSKDRDILSNPSSMMNLLYQIQQVNGPSPSSVDLEAAADKFRDEQSKRIQGQNQSSPAAPGQVNPTPIR